MAVSGITRADAEALFIEQVSPRVIEQAIKSSVALATIPTIPMGSGTTRIPVLSALPTGGFLNGDQAVKPLSEAAWDKKILTAEEVAVIVPISETVIADTSGVDVVAKVTELIGQEFGRVVDAAVYFGAGAPASWPTGGINGVAAAAGHTVVSTGDPAEDFNALLALLEEADYDPSRVNAGRRLKGVLRGMRDGQGSAVYNPLDGGVNTGSLYGVPLSFPLGWDAAAAEALTHDNLGVVLGLRSDVSIKILTEATLTGWGNLAEKDSIAVRATMRLGFQIANPVTLETGTRVFPVARLAPAPAPIRAAKA